MGSLSERITTAISGLGGKRKASPSENERNNPSVSKPLFPRYQPWDQASLHRRLDTFRPLTWFSKPSSVGPVACASRGWLNESRDTLCCEFCNSHLSYPRAVPHDMIQTAAEEFGKQLVTSHAPMCPWRASPCAESVLAYKPVAKSDAAAEHHVRLHQLQRLDLLPPVESRALEDVLRCWEGGDQQALITLISEVRSVSDEASIASSSEAEGRRPPAIAGSPAAPTEAAGSDSISCSFPSKQSISTVTTPSKQRLGLKERAALLALCGWELQIVAAESNSTVQSLTHTASYGLSHLMSSPAASKRRKSSLPSPSPAVAAAPGSSSGTAIPAVTQPQQQAETGEPVSMLNAVLNCSHCHARVGLWNYSGLRPSTLGRFQPPLSPELSFSTPRTGNTPSAVPGGSIRTPVLTGAEASSKVGPSLDRLSCTIAGGGFVAPRSSANSPAPAAGFSFGSFSSRSAAFGLQALGPSSIASPQPVGATVASAAATSLPSSATTTPLKSQAGTSNGQPETSQSSPQGTGQKPSSSAAASPQQPASSSGTPLQAAYVGAGHIISFAATPAAAREPFDPLRHHRSWCPWVYTGADTANLTGPSAAHRHTCGWQHTLEALKAPAADGERGEEAAVEEHSNGNRNLAQRLIASLRGR